MVVNRTVGEPYRIPMEHLCSLDAGSGFPVGHYAEALLEGKSGF